MESCCSVKAEAPDPRRCPGCGASGRRVELVTLKALLTPAALPKLQPAEHYFCAGASCPVVYFGEGVTFGRGDVAVPVFQKEPDGRRTVCYCFDVREDQIRQEVERVGHSPSAERIRKLVHDDRCACEVRNPQGSCCLGNVAAVAKSVTVLLPT